MVDTFSGTHAYREQCLRQRITADVADGGDTYYSDADEQAGVLDELVHEGRCPRCGGPMPEPPILPAGSRVTSCRCIPICGPCGSDEGTHTIAPSWWTPDEEFRDDRDQRRAEWVANSEVVTVDMASEGGKILSDDGVADVRLREHPGGWAEFGRD